jgi:hypothetical protein
MALALEFKQRVRMVPDPPARRVRERRPPVLLLGLCGWLGAVTFGFGVDQGFLPIGRWVEDLERSSDDQATARVGQPLEPERPVSSPRAPPPEAVEPRSSPPEDVGFRTAPLPRAESPASTSEQEPNPRVPQRASAGSERYSEEDTLGDDPSSLESRPASAVQTPEFDHPLQPATRRMSWADATRAPSCEAAVAAHTEEIVMHGGRSRPDITEAQYASILEHGRWFEHCGVPAACRLEVCVAVREGRAVGVTVHSTPWRADIERCVAAAARGLTFPSHPRMDVTRTTFAPR